MPPLRDKVVLRRGFLPLRRVSASRYIIGDLGDRSCSPARPRDLGVRSSLLSIKARPFLRQCTLLLVVVLMLATLAGCGRRVRQESRDQTLVASDGVSLSARVYIPTKSGPPGLVLVHRQGATATHWEPLAVRAQQSGYLVVAFDLRGHGNSRDANETPLDFRRFNDTQWQGVLLDIDAAVGALMAAGADPNNLFIAGEGLGASLALQYAVGHPEIQGVVMLSPGLDYHGIAAEPLLAQLAHRPALLVWSEGDAYAASSGAVLKSTAPGHVETHTYAGTAHGTDLLATSPQSIGQIVVWLNQMLDTDGTTEKAHPDRSKST